MHIAICDDNQEHLEEESHLVSKVLQEKNIAYTMIKFTNPYDLIKTDLSYDLIFLDIEMNEINGLEVARAMREKNNRSLLFFVTNYENYMDSALDEYAFRFWVKPINKVRLKKGIESAIKRMENYHRVIEINIDRMKTNLEIRKIIYVCAENKKTRIVTTENEYLISEPFKIIKKMINSYCFYEPHASYYVNLNYVDTYNRTSVICGSDKKKYEIYMSRRKYANFNEYFIDWIGDQV